MTPGPLAMIFGIGFLALGLIGFTAAPPPPDAPPLIVEEGHGLMLGMFPVTSSTTSCTFFSARSD